MSKALNLTNALAATPTFSVTELGLNAVSITVTDGLGGEVNLRVPRNQAKNMANALNGTVNGQVRKELEQAEAAGVITEVQAKRLKKIRDAAAHTAEMNAARSAAAAERKAGSAKAAPKLKAVG